ncbi:MAG: hypothetical protein JWO83_2577 [Caulobacteraceae bacterium]|nr:hypothetical protein [Caulobacteraceae bacterium]
MASGGLGIAAVGAAWRFLATAWRQAWAAMLLTGALIGALGALGLWAPRSPWRLEALLVVAAAAAMAEGALYRIALGKERPGPAGLQWGRAEWRLGAVWGLTAAFLFVLGLLAFVVVLATAFGVATSGRGFVMALPATWAAAVDARGRAVVAVVGALCAAGLVWAGTRIALGAPASIDRGKVQLLATWAASRRLVAPILLGRVLLGVGPIGLAWVLLRAASRGGHPVGALPLWAASLGAGFVLAGLWLPLSVGLMAYLYRRSPAAQP